MLNKFLSFEKTKKHYVYRFLGITLSLKHFCDYRKFCKFLFHQIMPKTILIIEPNGCHYETMPGLCKYCLELGYNVDILTREPAENIFDKLNFKNVNYYECNPLTFDRIYKFFNFNKYERIIYNSKRVYFSKNGLDLDGYDLSDYYKSVKKGQKQNIYLQHHIDKINDTPNDKQIILANPLRDPKLEKFVVNTNYFKNNIQINNKNEITNFISIGELSNARRNSSLLVDAVKRIKEKGITNFKITIIGKGNLNDLPLDIQQYFNILGRVDYQSMFKEIEKSDFILPLLDPEIKAHKRYMESGTSGTFQLIYGFNKPCIIHKIFADIYNFNNTNSLIYSDNYELSETILRAINLSNSDYKSIKNELNIISKNINDISKNNLINLLGGE